MTCTDNVYEVLRRDVDGRGRITLSDEYAGKAVKVAVVEVATDRTELDDMDP